MIFFFKNKLFLALFLMKIIGILSISNSQNEPSPPNELGETSKDCSYQYCLEKDSLSLWLSLQSVCSSTPNPYFFEINSQETSYNNNFSPIVSASLCAMSSVISLMLGYVIAHHYHKKVVYTQLKDNDDF
jgi:hypothetical protein